MSLTSVLERVKNAILPVIEQNGLLDAFLGSPSDEVAVAEAKIEAWGYGADDIESGTVDITGGSALVTLVGNITDNLQINDDFVIAGSKEGNGGLFVITNINSSTTLTLNHTFSVTETGLFFGKTKSRLIKLAKGMNLFPQGTETDAAIRTDILARAGTIHQLRGTTQGIIEDLGRISGASIQLEDTVKALTQLSTGVSTTSGGATMTVSTWANSLTVGSDFTVALSTIGSNGRYFVYSNSGTAITPARRAINSTQYYQDMFNATEVHFREDRSTGRLYWRVINSNGSASNRVTVSIAVTGATVSSFGMNGGSVGDSVGSPVSGTVNTQSSSGANAYWDVTNGQSKEGWVQVSSIPNAEFTVTVSQAVGTLNAVRHGRAGLASRDKSGNLVLGALPKVRFGGLILTNFRSDTSESGLTVYQDGYPGFYMGFGYLGTYENDDYPMASPDDFVVIDVDHRNYGQYSELEVKNLAQDQIIPVDTEYVIGFV